MVIKKYLAGEMDFILTKKKTEISIKTPIFLIPGNHNIHENVTSNRLIDADMLRVQPGKQFLCVIIWHLKIFIVC